MKTSNKILICLIILALAGGAWYYINTKKSTPTTDKLPKNSKGNRRPPTPAVLDSVTSEDVEVAVSAIGTIIANKQAIIQPRVEGLLESINFKEGSFIKKGQLIAKIDARNFQAALMNAKGQLAKDEAQLQIAKLDLDRYQTLLEQDSIARQQVETQKALVAQLQGIVTSDKANVNAAQLNVSYTNVVAPISGKIGLNKVDIGNIVRTGDVNGIAVITEVNPIAASFSVPQENLSEVVQTFEERKKDNKFIEVQAVGRDNSILKSGKITAIDNQADVSTGSVKIKAEFENADNKLFTGQFVNIRIILQSIKNAITIPQSAVQRGTNTFVYKVENKKAKVTPVILGNNFKDKVIIQQGLNIGDMIVIDGLDKLKDNAPISDSKNANFNSNNALENSSTKQNSNSKNKNQHKSQHLKNPQ